MLIGVHKGKKMIDIPDSYFKWLIESGKAFKGLKHYAQLRIKRVKIALLKLEKMKIESQIRQLSRFTDTCRLCKCKFQNTSEANLFCEECWKVL